MTQTPQQDPLYTRDQDSELNIESIISAPLIALSKANTVMLNGQTQAILDQYFVATKKEEGEQKKEENQTIYKPKMINMTITKPVEIKGEMVNHEMIFQIPLLSIAPINSIAIDKMKVSFNLEITSTTSYINGHNGIIERKAQLNGKISNEKHESAAEKKYAKSNQKALKIDIQAHALPLPLGILNILDLYNKNIQPLTTKNHDAT
ncbi:DUF2589 domain-containing protein [Myroides sp. 1354]|uniref:DUF2589 domain-containing protein n=1 Tax=unclassified Myroides TaxID=2642485 RepID=UPI0025749974|nr:MULTISPECIES: DUF2589 domain-containing protein [unclassified Myroides]MDM1046044.1 DUF2589 domain-containing protein [Myroides sp. R163-1]MDM1056980.1 DUF2589 domain-containing protein [Myroides sp. 1354]MDM1070175.1 DUF2589 domain-containing protein [Myroides sp. 1372]